MTAQEFKQAIKRARIIYIWVLFGQNTGEFVRVTKTSILDIIVPDGHYDCHFASDNESLFIDS